MLNPIHREAETPPTPTDVVQSGAAGAGYTFSESALPADEISVGCIVVSVSECGELSPEALAIDRISDGALTGLVERNVLTGQTGTAVYVPLPERARAQAAMVIGVGSDRTVPPLRFKQIVESAHDGLVKHNVSDAALFLSSMVVQGRDEHWKVRQQVICCEAAAYRYRSKVPSTNSQQLHKIVVATLLTGSPAVFEGLAIADGIRTARLLGDMPPNVCTPTYLADVASSLANRFPSIETEIVDEARMNALGMHAMLSVGRGSAQPSKLIVLKYAGRTEGSADPMVLIGKGVTFDSGGTSLKTRDAMSHMKYDMCGAAVVIAAIKSAAMLELPIDIVALCPCAENMPGSNATRPSDTVATLSGKTVEILNPDAEGRLLLCDALSYAERFEPAIVIDVATLTGASVVALGRHYSALFSNNDELADDLLHAGEVAIDKTWRLPLSAEDMDQLDSQYADIANMGDGTAGCVVAALFLSKFAGTYPWAHIDVSGTAKQVGRKPYATGRPVSLLMHYLINRTVSATQ